MFFQVDITHGKRKLDPPLIIHLFHLTSTDAEVNIGIIARLHAQPAPFL